MSHVLPSTASLTLGHVLTSIGAGQDPPIQLKDILVIRHVFKKGEPHLQGPEDLTDARVLAYTRGQEASTKKFPSAPAKYWVVLIADGKKRSRLFCVYENHGEVFSERTEDGRAYDLRKSEFLAPLAGRLVVDWANPLSWYMHGTTAAKLPVLEIADRDKVPFPGFDRVLLTFHELQDMVTDRRYADWQAALREVQGIYLITDSSTGKQYVGKADGSERLLGRWTAYASDGHGGNKLLRQLSVASKGSTAGDHARHFRFSILRVFGPSTSLTEVNEAESHHKRALMTREFGLNEN
jgi:hypothetical protein